MIPSNAKQLINRCIDLGIHLSNGENGTLHTVSPAGAMTDDLRQALRENKAEIIATINGERPDKPLASTIKAIETHYKGYRMRSRLEARWAVFFDALGEPFEYEKEGFELGDGVRYLPDFWLPRQRAWVEIKPSNYKAVAQSQRASTKDFYFAGKIHANDWRHNIVRGLRDINPDASGTGYPSFPFDQLARYVGPFFISDDHKCAHGNATHGRGENCTDDGDTADVIVRRSLTGIDQAGVLFAWINEADCYGTLAEIGYAKAKGKEIWIAISQDLIDSGDIDAFVDCGKHCEPRNDRNEMWFIQHLADKYLVAATAQDAWGQFYSSPSSLPADKAELLAVSLAKANRQEAIWRIEGEPWATFNAGGCGLSLSYVVRKIQPQGDGTVTIDNGVFVVCRTCGTMGVEGRGTHFRDLFPDDDEFWGFCCSEHASPAWHPRLIAAYAAARSARFGD